MFFAGDGVIIAPNVRIAQDLLHKADNWSHHHSMVFNIRKCGHLISTNRNLDIPNSFLYLQDTPIPQVHSYKYLGVIISRSGVNYSALAQLLNSPVQKQINAMRWVSDTWCPRIRYNIFKVILSPTLEYLLPILCAEYLRNENSPSWKVLYASYYDSIRWIAGGNANRPHITCNLLGLLLFKDRAIQLSGRFYQHLVKSDQDNPLRCILVSLNWFPKSNIRVRLEPNAPLIYQFLNPPKWFDR